MAITINSVADSLTPVGISALGTVIFDNLTFPAGNYIDLNGNTQSYNEVALDAVQISVSRAKEIIKSKVSGRDGSIKEYVSADDYVINAVAIIAGKNFTVAQIAAIAAAQIVEGAAAAVGFNPTSEDTELLQAISDIQNVPDRVEVRSKTLQNYFGINYVVIESMDFERTDPSTFRVRFTMLSDFDTDLKDFG